MKIAWDRKRCQAWSWMSIVMYSIWDEKVRQLHIVLCCIRFSLFLSVFYFFLLNKSSSLMSFSSPPSSSHFSWLVFFLLGLHGSSFREQSQRKRRMSRRMSLFSLFRKGIRREIEGIAIFATPSSFLPLFSLSLVSINSLSSTFPVLSSFLPLPPLPSAPLLLFSFSSCLHASYFLERWMNDWNTKTKI